MNKLSVAHDLPNHLRQTAQHPNLQGRNWEAFANVRPCAAPRKYPSTSPNRQPSQPYTSSLPQPTQTTDIHNNNNTHYKTPRLSSQPCSTPLQLAPNRYYFIIIPLHLNELLLPLFSPPSAPVHGTQIYTNLVTIDHIILCRIILIGQGHRGIIIIIIIMSVKQARQALMNGGESIIGKLESAELQATANEIRVDGKQRSEIQELLNNHKSCFPKQLSNKLPPRRAVRHNIDIQPDSNLHLVHLTGYRDPRQRNCRNSWSNCYNRDAFNPADLHNGTPVFVKMADSSLRLAYDWRPLNSITV